MERERTSIAELGIERSACQVSPLCDRFRELSKRRFLLDHLRDRRWFPKHNFYEHQQPRSFASGAPQAAALPHLTAFQLSV
jgi:hypothetical protein